MVAANACAASLNGRRVRQLERDSIVARIVHAQVPPKVEYHLTEWGQSLCPALDELLTWAERQPSSSSRAGASATSAVGTGLKPKK